MQFLGDGQDCAIRGGGIEQRVHRQLDQSTVETLDGVLVAVGYPLASLRIGHPDVEVGVVDLDGGMRRAINNPLKFKALPGGHVLERRAVAVEPASAVERPVEDSTSDRD